MFVIPGRANGRRYAPPVDRLRASGIRTRGRKKACRRCDGGHFGALLNTNAYELMALESAQMPETGQLRSAVTRPTPGAGQPITRRTGRQIEDATADERPRSLRSRRRCGRHGSP